MMKYLYPQWLKDSTLSSVIAGFITVLVGFTSSVALIFQAAHSLNAGADVISSWMWALSLGMGLTSLGLSWWYKIPLITAWSTPGAALLITALSGYTVEQAIGSFVVTSLFIVLSGVTGVFERFMNKIPQSIGAAMLAGILVNFGLKVFTAMQVDLTLPLALLVSYLFLKHFLPKYTIIILLILGIIICVSQGTLDLSKINIQLAKPVFIMPEFSLIATISVALPLFVVTMTSQNIPGVTVLKTSGYSSPTSASLSATGGVGLLLAPFGCFALNLAAITAAICMTPDVHPDKNKRYTAGIWTGIFYIIIGIFGATVASAFSAFPQIFVATLAGIALFGTIGNGLFLALADDTSREPALISFLTTASGVTLWGIGSAFWGIVFGIVALLVFSIKKRHA